MDAFFCTISEGRKSSQRSAPKTAPFSRGSLWASYFVSANLPPSVGIVTRWITSSPRGRQGADRREDDSKLPGWLISLLCDDTSLWSWTGVEGEFTASMAYWEKWWPALELAGAGSRVATFVGTAVRRNVAAAATGGDLCIGFACVATFALCRYGFLDASIPHWKLPD
jgi:hypothetical protein